MSDKGNGLISLLEYQEFLIKKTSEVIFGHVIKRISNHVNLQCSSLVEEAKESIGYVPLSRNHQFESHKELIVAQNRCKYRKSALCWTKPPSSSTQNNFITPTTISTVSTTSSTNSNTNTSNTAIDPTASTDTLDILKSNNSNNINKVLKECSPTTNYSSSSTLSEIVDSNEQTPSISSESISYEQTSQLINNYVKSVLQTKVGDQYLLSSPPRQRKQSLKAITNSEYPLFEIANAEGVSRLDFDVLEEILEIAKKCKYSLNCSINDVYRDGDDTDTDLELNDDNNDDEDEEEDEDDDFEVIEKVEDEVKPLYFDDEENEDEDYEIDEDDDDDDREVYQHLRQSQRSDYDDLPYKFLPVEESPKTIWSEDRIDHVSRQKWMDYKRSQFELKKIESTEYIKYIRNKKPLFQFDESFASNGNPTKYNVPPASTGYVQYFTETNGKINRHVVRGGLESLSFLSNNSLPDDDTCISRRCLPVKPFHQRKIFQIGGIHNLTSSSRKSTITCDCMPKMELCSICSGKTMVVCKTNNELKSVREINALLDHSYHKNLTSLNFEGKTKFIFGEAVTKGSGELATRANEAISHKKATGRFQVHPPKISQMETLLEYVLRRAIEQNQSLPGGLYKNDSSRKRKSSRQISSSILSRRKRYSPSKNYEESDDHLDDDESFNKKRRKEANDFDINKFVIPTSMAASTRVEKITYKEIVTPTWRSFDDEKMKNSEKLNVVLDEEEEEKEDKDDFEDISDEAVRERHERGLIEEAKKFLKNSMFGQRTRSFNLRTRTDSITENYDPNSPESFSIYGATDSPTLKPEDFNNSTWENIPSNQGDSKASIKAYSNAPLVSAAAASLAASALRPSALLRERRIRRRKSKIVSSDDDDDVNDKDSKKELENEVNLNIIKIEEHELGDEVYEPSDNMEIDDDWRDFQVKFEPFEPRTFPLQEEEYEEMKKEMSLAYYIFEPMPRSDD